MADAKTVLAGSLFNESKIVQVTPESVLLLKGTKMEQKISLSSLLGRFDPEEVSDKRDRTDQASKPVGQSQPEIQKSSNVFYDFGSLPEETSEFMLEDQSAVDLKIDFSSSVIRSAAACDSLLLLTFSNGRAMILFGDQNSRQLSPLESALEDLFNLPRRDSQMIVATACLFEDRGRWFESTNLVLAIC